MVSVGREICRHFQRGKCRFGAKCKFSHQNDSSAMKSNTSTRQGRVPRSADEQADFDELSSWKRLLKDNPRGFGQCVARDLWVRALCILDTGNRQLTQNVIDCLVDKEGSEGLRHVKIILDLDGGQCRLNGAAISSFLQVITHPALLECLSIDSQVGDLYNFISGSGGAKAVSFFENVCEFILEDQLGFLNENIEKNFLSAATGLFEVLKRSIKSQLANGMPALLDNLVMVFEASNISDDSKEFNHIKDRLAQMKRIVQRANGDLTIPELDPAITIPATVSTFPRDLILPINRHDNDNLDITKIRILPTIEELLSDCPEFLPSTNPNQPHFLEGIERLFDTHFRLLRHDVLGEMKSAIGGLVASINQDPYSDVRPGLGQIRAFSYNNAQVSFLNFDRQNGLEAQISFAQPRSLIQKSERSRATWWREGKRLERGSLLCLVTSVGGHVRVVFLTVSQKLVTDQKEHRGLSSDDHNPTISAKLAKKDDQDDLSVLLQLNTSHTSASTTLIEFPGILLGTFVPILENLQDMQRLSRLPFQSWIIPKPISSSTIEPNIHVPPPVYARGAGFSFNLAPILKRSDDIFSLRNQTSPNDEATIRQVEDKTILDHGQSQALITALVQEFSLIQGPPGCGKSFLGVEIVRVLLANKVKANLGPIIVICYTNHALDQFLESLVTAGIDKIIRMGGQSHSKVLEGKNLRLASKDETKSKMEGFLLWQAFSDRQVQEESIQIILRRLRGLRKRNWKNLERYLSDQHPLVYHQFSRHHDGWEIAGDAAPFDFWAKPSHKNDAEQSTRPLSELLKLSRKDIHSLESAERESIIDYWVDDCRKIIQNLLFHRLQADFRQENQCHMVYADVDRRVLQTADVIGVTTSGMAKNIETLRHIKAKTIICEEAGEVLEAHFLSALLPSVEQVIQIGDHQQLRPQINSFDLSLESNQGYRYQLDRSNFERLSVGENGIRPFPVAQLDTQRRMRPEISNLVRHTMYPRLIDHSNVLEYPDVVGMRKNVFWLDHDNPETGSKADDVANKSHSNEWEVEMTHALVRHIIRQGEYKSKDLAVLTPYSGQLQKLRRSLQDDFEIVLSDRDQETLDKDGFATTDDVDNRDVNDRNSNNQASTSSLQKRPLNELLRIATVDNFQGEEAKIVIISLVRSNPQRKVGFLKTKNRINVLLSRAKHGLFLIGNTDTASRVPMWSEVIGMLRVDDCVGRTLGLCCPRHQSTEIQVSMPEDFSRYSPEGGCNLPCDRRLENCGHRCFSKCHSDQMHRTYSCPQSCQRLHADCRHGCPKTCGESCGSCKVNIDNVALPCGHMAVDIPCHIATRPENIFCTVIVCKKVPNCGHTVDMKCHEDATITDFQCSHPCEEILSCGHQCSGTCGGCTKQTETEHSISEHNKCTKRCGRNFTTCTHTCQKSCHDGISCGVCTASCDVKCSHSRCDRPCHEPCAPCIQQCTWVCEHQGQCVMPCAAPCDRLPCNLRCSQILKCGHQCPSLCGEECPADYCQLCCSEDKKEHRVDMILLQSYSEIDLNDTPIVVLCCGHFFTAESLDGIYRMSDVYEVQNGEFSGLRNSLSTLTSLPLCPDCRCIIQQFSTQRFNRVVNQAVMDETTRRLHSSGQANIQELTARLDKWEQELKMSRKELMDQIEDTQVQTTSQELTRKVINRSNPALHLKIIAFLNGVSREQQPQTKLDDAIGISRKKQSLQNTISQISIVDTRTSHDQIVLLGGESLEINFRCIHLADKLSLMSAMLKRSEPFELISKNAALFWGRVAMCYQAVARFWGPDHITKAQGYVDRAKELLEIGKDICGSISATDYKSAMDDMLSRLDKARYETVTEEEMFSVRQAMRWDLGSSTGHWYTCLNGHPFAVGECGLPMQEARCPECGAAVGGRDHEAVAGVRLAREMDL